MRVRILWILIFVFPFFLSAQEDLDDNAIRQSIIEQRIETIVEGLDEGEELDFTTLFDDLVYYYEHPLNLNRATDEELRDLYLLSEVQIQALRVHMLRFGKLDSVYELQAIPGFDLETIYNLLPFVRVSESSLTGRESLKTILRDGRSDLFIRYQQVLEEQRGYAPATADELSENPGARYLGSSARLYTRYRFTYRNNLSIGLTAEKDPGEEFFQGSQKNGFDFYSAHLYYKDNGLVRAMVIGDYQVQFGQGLALWSGLGFGKSAFAMNVKRSTFGIRPYTAVDENRFLRGGAITLGKGKVQFTAFYSRKKIDANIASSTDTTAQEEELQVTSFQLSGFHRTENELFDKDALPEQHLGGNISYRTPRFRISATGLHTSYDGVVTRNLQLYNQFDFNNNENWVGSVDYQALIRNINVFGEVARSQSGGMAALNGAMMALSPRLSMVVMHRYYERDFQSILANAFAEGTRPANEQGLYFGFEAGIARRWSLSGYFDRFRFPWLRFQVDAPSEGYDALVQLTHKPSKKSEFYLRYRHREKDRNLTIEDEPIDYPVDQIQENIRLNAAYQVTEGIRFKSRLELSGFQLGAQPEERGMLLSHDVIFKKVDAPWSVSFRYALFDTDSYNARIYSYESDVLYAFSIPAYNGRGSRVYAMLRYKLARGVDLWLRWSQWYYTDRQVISSGLEEIQGNRRSEVKAQLRLRF